MKKEETLYDKISQAIWELMSENCRRENLIIAYSPLVEIILTEELFSNHLYFEYSPSKTLEKLEDIEIYRLHPYNEIVVYDAKYSFQNPKLVKSIPIKLNTTTTYEKT